MSESYDLAGKGLPIPAEINRDWLSEARLRAQLAAYPARQIGALGSIPFYVSSSTVQTIHNIVWSGSGSYSEHKRIGSTTLVEATGSDADTITFDMLLSADLGVNPWDALTKLLTAVREQNYLQLTIGDHAYGRYRWLAVDYKIKMNQHDVYGNLTECVVSVKLVEYLKE